MSNIILNADISENSSFVSKLSKISTLLKSKRVIPSKISEPDNNNIQPIKSSLVSNLYKTSTKPTVLNADMSENSSLASNLTKISQLSKKNAVLQNTTYEPEPKSRVLRSDATSESESKLSYQRSVASTAYSENSTHVFVHSYEKSNPNTSTNTSTNTSINNPYIINNSNNFISNDITNRVVIDVAVLCQEYTTIEAMCNDNIINLDEIPIKKDCFQSIFYPYHENFGLNKEYVFYNKFVTPYISFLPEFRRVNTKNFYLLEELISNIERDLNISRNCFTKDSLVELTNEIISIKSLCDVNCCSVLSSLSWPNVLEIIKNYQLINCCQCVHFNNEHETYENYCPICKTSKSEIIPICVVNIIFKTPTPGVKNTIIRFNYRITDL